MRDHHAAGWMSKGREMRRPISAIASAEHEKGHPMRGSIPCCTVWAAQASRGRDPVFTRVAICHTNRYNAFVLKE